MSTQTKIHHGGNDGFNKNKYIVNNGKDIISNSPNNVNFDTAMIINGLKAIHKDNELFEIRFFKPYTSKENKLKYNVHSGYFNNHEQALKAIIPYIGKFNIFQTLNTINPDIVQSDENLNKIKPYANNTTNDNNITKRCYIPIDIDPCRNSKTSSTNEQLNEANKVKNKIITFLSAEGWQPYLIACSGNGYHILYKTNLDNTEDNNNLIETLLLTLSNKFNTDNVKLDKSIYNPSRIWKVYGTIACKGDNTKDTPHRLATIEVIKKDADTITLTQIKNLIGNLSEAEQQPIKPKIKQPVKTIVKGGYQLGEILRYLEVNGILPYEFEQKIDKLTITPNTCLTVETNHDSDDSGYKLILTKQPNGTYRVNYKCHHNSCSGKGWYDVKKRYGDVRKRIMPSDNYTIAKDWLNSVKDNVLYSLLIPTSELTTDRIKNEYGAWFVYTGKCWVRTQKKAILTRISKYIHNKNYVVKEVQTKKIFNFAENIVIKNLEDKTDHAPIWQQGFNYIAFNNGDYNLSTHKLEKHHPKHYILGMLKSDFNPNSKGQYLNKYLDTIRSFKDGQETLNFLQEYAGYCLTSDVKHNLALWLHGPMGCGKSTFLELIRVLLNGKAKNLNHAEIDKDTKLSNAIINSTALLGDETNKGGRTTVLFNTDIYNNLVDGQTLPLTIKGDTFNYKPCVKLLWAMCNVPSPHGNDRGYIRRTKLIQFEKLPVNKVDENLKENLKNEVSAIFNWAIIGLIRLQARGKFDIPTHIQKYSNRYFGLGDSLSDFIQAECNTHNDAYSKLKSLYDAYKRWCNDMGIDNPLKQKEFKNKLLDIGIKYERSTTGEQPYFLLGIALNSNSEYSINEQPLKPISIKQ